MGAGIRSITLEGKRVRLEPLTPEHLDELCSVGLDEALWHTNQRPVRTREDMRRYIVDAIAGKNAGAMLPFVTIDKTSGRVVGSTRYGNIDLDNRRVEIGWTWIAGPWQRTGVNREAKYLMLRHAFEELGCVRVEFKTDVLNERSRTALLRLGATEEGILRQHILVEGGRMRDTVYYSILAEEWPAVKERLERQIS